MSAQPSAVEVSGVERFDIVERILGPLERRNPKQQQLLHQVFDEHKEYLLYGGAAGGGKSHILRWIELIFLIVVWKLYGIRNVRAGLFCEDYPSLRDRQISKMKSEFPSFLGRLRDTREEGLVWQLREDLGGGFIAPRNLDKPEKYDSTEFALIGVDELTKNPPEIFDELRKRLRWPGFPEAFVFPFIGCSNPGGIGHGWVKQYWLDRDFPPELKDKADQFVFIQALAQDNKYLSQKYYRDLLTLPEQMRRAYAFGDWDVFVGQFFSDWRRTVHICKRFQIPHYWRRFTAEDWGFAKPWCRLWFAVSPEGVVIAYREQYEVQKLPEWMAKEGVRLSEKENIEYRLGDPAMWSKEGAAYGMPGPPIAQQLADHGWNLVKATSDRIPGWQQVRAFIQFERNKAGELVRPPMFQVMDGTCPNLVRTLPAQVFNKLNVEDLDSEAEDHASDTLRYGLMSRPRPTIVPLEELDLEWAEAALRAAHKDKAQRKSGANAADY